MLFLIIVIAQFWIVGYLANQRGRSFILWGALTLFISVFALIPLYLIKDLKREESIKSCPKCYGEMDKRATVCPHCRSEVSYTDQLQILEDRYDRGEIV